MSVKNHSDLSNEITSDITNNGSQLITGLVLQSKLLDLSDSAVNILGDTIQGKLTYSSLFSISATGDLTHKSYVDGAISTAVSSIDLSPYFKKDGTVAMTGSLPMNGNSITGVTTIGDSLGGNIIDLTAYTINDPSSSKFIDFSNRSAGLKIYNSSGKKAIFDFSALSVDRSIIWQNKAYTGVADLTDITAANVGNTTAQWNANKLLGNTIPVDALGYLHNDGAGNLTWTAAGGGTTTNALTVDNSSLQLNSGTTFDGSAAKTISVKALGITNAMLAGSIAYSKLSLTGSVVDGDLATSYIKADGTRGLAGAWYNSQNASFSMLGVGTGSTAPSATLHTIETGTSSPRGVLHDQYNTGVNSSQLNLRKARGTFASPTVITTGDILSNLNTWAYDGSGFINSAAIRVTSVGTIGTSRTPSKMEFMTMTDVSTGVLTTALTLDQSQNATFAGAVSIAGTGGNGWMSLVSQSSAPTLSAGDTKLYVYADSSSRLSLAKRNAADSATITRTLIFNDASVNYTFPTTNTDTLAGLGTAQTFTAQQTFTGSSIQVASVSILDTTYKTVLDVAGSNQVRVGNSFATTVIQSTTLVLTGTTIQPSTNTSINPAAGSTGTGVTISRQATITNVGAAFKQLSITGNYAPAGSGAGTFVGISLDSTINETSTANQVVTMVDINPTLTSVQAALYGLRTRIASAPTGGGTAWNIYADGTASNYIAGNTGIGTNSLGTAFLTIAASTTAKAALNFISGSAPTSPNDGDFWFDGTNYKARIGGATKTFTLT